MITVVLAIPGVRFFCLVAQLHHDPHLDHDMGGELMLKCITMHHINADVDINADVGGELAKRSSRFRFMVMLTR